VFKMANMIAFLVWFLAVTVQAQELVADPTKPLGFVAATGSAATAGSAQDTIQLTSILIASDRKLVIINGQSLHENQTLKGVGIVVKKIDADAVTLQQNGKVWRVALNNTAIRK
jgi:type II secretory pathway component PulC